MTPNLQIEYRPIDALLPYARNPRTHSPAQITKIAASIVEFGWTQPILVDGDNGIIAGHGRLAAARKLELAEVPVIELGHLSPAQKRAYVIADNRLALDAGWDEELLALELAELSEAGYDLLMTGFDDDELAQLLARLERTKAEAAYRETEAKVGALSATLARVRAEIFGGAPEFGPETAAFPEFRQNQSALLRKRRDAINQEIAAMERMRGLALRELRMTEPLLATGDVSMAEVLRLQRQVADIEGQMTNRRNKYLQECQMEMNKAEEELAGAVQMLVQRRDQLANTELKAPVKGTVKNVRVTTRGGVLRPGDELMQIVPIDDALVVEARVKPADVAFLKPGLDVAVKIDAYDYTIYGSLDGKLSYISADTLNEDVKQNEQPYYRVQVVTESPRFTKRAADNLQLQPGMTATIEVKTGQNTVLNYILKPVVKTLSESMGER